ncbi:MAG: 4Fe-4S dicluster domain-containing protein [Candidatus Lokiarchaeota archaeon]|nr:4Fe-4S dicluster domain-containing protein [Candidatus Lokiarchaeota archaeon]
MNRKIIKIDEELCTGCGNCIVDCAEGALKIIDGKARVINDVFCDGLGACISGCPEGALEIIEREAVEFDEEAVEDHLESMKHQEKEELKQVKQIVTEHAHQCGCQSAKTMVFDEPETQSETVSGKIPSELRQWPVQMHLINPRAPYYQGADVLLAADCVGFSYGDFHRDFLKQKSIAIACPKLDQGKEVYVEKIKALIEDSKINTLTVAMMEVPCCGGLLGLAQEAAKRANRKVPIKYVIIGVQGNILKEEWV